VAVKLASIIDAVLPLAMVATLAAACCRQAVREEGPPPVPRQWCTTFVASTERGSLDGEACVTAKAACDAAVVQARRLGGLAGLRSIGDCRWKETR
jgi:hypothetical protein